MEAELDSATGVSGDSRVARPVAVFGYLLSAGVLGVIALLGGGPPPRPDRCVDGVTLEWLKGAPFSDYTCQGRDAAVVSGPQDSLRACSWPTRTTSRCRPTSVRTTLPAESGTPTPGNGQSNASGATTRGT